MKFLTIMTCAPKTPPNLCRVRPTKGRTNEGATYGRTDHSNYQRTGIWRDELNATYTQIIAEAQANAPSPAHINSENPAEGPRLGVGRPRYQRARLLGQRSVTDLATEYLADVSSRLRPGMR